MLCAGGCRGGGRLKVVHWQWRGQFKCARHDKVFKIYAMKCHVQNIMATFIILQNNDLQHVRYATLCYATLISVAATCCSCNGTVWLQWQ